MKLTGIIIALLAFTVTANAKDVLTVAHEWGRLAATHCLDFIGSYNNDLDACREEQMKAVMLLIKKGKKIPSHCFSYASKTSPEGRGSYDFTLVEECTRTPTHCIAEGSLPGETVPNYHLVRACAKAAKK